MITISLCMIVKNEEAVLGRCLACVHGLVDEIIIVDTGSSDNTKKLAFGYTYNIFDFSWTDDFASARNYAFSKATKEYCMWLDADDVMTERDISEFIKMKHTLTSDIDIVMMRYVTAYDENNEPSFWCYRERLIKNNQKYFWQGAVHEAIAPAGNIKYSDICILHKKIRQSDADRNLNIYKRMISAGKSLGTRDTYYYAWELYYHSMYAEALEAFNKFLSLNDAWLENKIDACLIMSKCFQAVGNQAERLRVLLRSLEYDLPRAEICCELGSCFMDAGKYEIAVFWFETALACRQDLKKGGFAAVDCYNYIPALQLCVCHYRLGHYGEAVKYNNLAGRFRPDSSEVLFNKTFFDKISTLAQKPHTI